MPSLVGSEMCIRDRGMVLENSWKIRPVTGVWVILCIPGVLCGKDSFVWGTVARPPRGCPMRSGTSSESARRAVAFAASRMNCYLGQGMEVAGFGVAHMWFQCCEIWAFRKKKQNLTLTRNEVFFWTKSGIFCFLKNIGRPHKSFIYYSNIFPDSHTFVLDNNPVMR